MGTALGSIVALAVVMFGAWVVDIWERFRVGR